MWIYLLQGLSLGLSGAASPGPFQAFLIGRSLSQGWRRTLPAALAPLITDGPIIALMLLALTRLPPDFLRWVRLAGGTLVIYLAWQAWAAWRDFQPVPDPAAADPGAGPRSRTLGQAVAMNFLSPGPYLFWSLLAGPVLVRGWRETPAHGLAFLAGFYAAMVGGLVLLVVIFAAARRLGPRVNRALLGFSALALLGFGLYQWAQLLVGGF